MFNILPTNWLVSLSFITLILLTPSIQTFNNNIEILIDASLIIINSAQIEATLIFDTTSLTILSVVSFISTNVLFFSSFYLLDPDSNNFYLILIIFISSIIIFSISTNIIAILLGWDGLGVSSFLLVAHYPTWTAAGSSIITIFTNRIGDVIIIISLIFIIGTGHWSLTLQTPSFSTSTPIILILVASATNSAHIPFNLWLPEAIAAPTPVSALVHSSTLVTAGILLTLRANHLITNYIITITVWIFGITTTLIAGIVASFIKDPNNVIAYSTISQLGIISMAIAIGFPLIALFHLITHAMFNALIFISIGIIITHNKHNQIITSNTNLITSTPSLSFNLSTLALNAFPFTAGFFSKELILESVITYWSELFTLIIFLPTSLTTLYSLRLLNHSLTSNSNNISLNTSTSNIHSTSPHLPTSLSLQSISATSIGAIISFTLTPNPPPLINLFQITTLISITIMGLIIIISQTMSPSNLLPPTNENTFHTYTNLSIWWLTENSTTNILLNTLLIYNFLENGLITAPINYNYHTIILLSASSTASNTPTFFILIISPITILIPLIIL